jgi:hypothetical protein
LTPGRDQIITKKVIKVIALASFSAFMGIESNADRERPASLITHARVRIMASQAGGDPREVSERVCEIGGSQTAP